MVRIKSTSNSEMVLEGRSAAWQVYVYEAFTAKMEFTRLSGSREGSEDDEGPI
jgi:hypothetical protein